MNSKNKIIRLILLIVFSAGVSIVTYSQVITPFTIRKTVTQKGNIVFLSNTASKATPDNVVQNEMPPSGTGYDNSFTNTYVDIDSDPTTFMSSSDLLNLTGCAQISWAGLYWGGDCSTGDENFATRNQVKIKVDNGSYISLTADYLKDNTTGYKSYHCYKNITSIVQEAGIINRYTVANVALDIAGKNLFGGWTIVVIYKDNLQNMRNLTVFDGLANVSSGNATVDIPISGFQTPLSGPVTFDLGLVAYDGDRSLTGDQLLFKGGSTFVNISDALHPVSDIFNSTISKNGVLTTNRIPGFNNTLGYDANIFSPNNSTKNYIGNDAISAIIRQTTGGETYLTQVVTSAIDVYEPDLRSSVRVKNITHPAAATATPGDVLEYTVTGMNIGSDPSINTFITDSLETNAIYVPNTLKILSGPNSGNLTDALNDDVGEYIPDQKVIKVRIGTGANSLKGGQVNNSNTGADSTQIQFRVRINDDCMVLACDNSVDNQSFIIGTGNVSGNTFSNSSNPEVFNNQGCPVSGTTKTPVSTSGCSAPEATVNEPICAGSTIQFNATESANATYFWEGPNGFTSTIRNPSISNASASHAGNYICKIYVTGMPCVYEFTIPVSITAASAGMDQNGSTTCGLTTVTLAANNPAGTTGEWTIVSGTGGSFSNVNSPSSSFSGTAGSSYVLRWTLDVTGCGQSTDDVNIKFNVGPSAASISGTSSICYNDYANVTVDITGGTAPYTVVLANNKGTFTKYQSGDQLVVGPLTASTTITLSSVTDANGCIVSGDGLSGSAVITVSDAISGTGVITELNPPSSSNSNTAEKNAGSISSSKFSTTSSNYSSSDNTYGSASLSTSNSRTITLTNFNFSSSSIPSNATILGVEVKIESKTDATSSISGTVVLYNNLSSGATNIGTSTNITIPTTESTVTYGSSSSLWGNTSISLSTINLSTFGVKITVNRVSSNTNSPKVYIDYVGVKIYYKTTSSYCDNSTADFSVNALTNATTYTWTPPAGARISSGQGTRTVTVDFNGSGQTGNKTISVVPSNNCQTVNAVNLTIPMSDCSNGSVAITGNVYWDTNGSSGSNKVDGTGIGSINGTQLYATLQTNTGTTAVGNSVAVAADGYYKLPASASTAYKVSIGSSNYTNGATINTPALPSGGAYSGEKANDVLNSATGNDGTADGKLSITTDATNNTINANFGVSISTPPVASNDVTSTNEDTQVTFNVTSNDTDADGTIDATKVDLDMSTAGVQSSFSDIYGSWSVNSSGVITYTPASNFNGNASIHYTVQDNSSLTSNQGTLLIAVAPLNDAPATTSDDIYTIEDKNVTCNILNNDFDVDGSIDVTTVDLDPSTPGIQTTHTIAGKGTFTVNSQGVLTFIPFANYNGTASINYTVKDNNGAVSSSTAITVHIQSVVDVPLAMNDEFTTNQNTAGTINVTSNDIGVDGGINVATVDLDPYTANIQTSLTNSEGTYTVNTTGEVTFTPLAAFYGQTTPIYYVVSDNSSQISNVAQIKFTVIATSSPVAVDDAVSTDQGTTVSKVVTNNDNSINGLNVAKVDLDPETAGIQQSYDIIDKGTFMVDNSGKVVFQPMQLFYGSTSVNYTVKDILGLVSNVAKLDVTVIQVNQKPIANNDAGSTTEDAAGTLDLVSNDTDADGSIDVASVDLDINTSGKQTTFTVANEGTYSVSVLGVVTFTPVANFNGNTTTIYYLVADNLGLYSDIETPGTITFTVSPINDVPVAVDDKIIGLSNANISFNISSNDNDIDGTLNTSKIDLNVNVGGIQSSFSVNGEGSYSADGDGMVTFVPVNGFVGPATGTTVKYTIEDNSGATSNQGSIIITLSSPDGPVAVDDDLTIAEDASATTIDILANDFSDANAVNVTTVDLDPLTANKQTTLNTSKGNWSVNTTTGILTFTPASNFFGTVVLNYTVNDGSSPTPLTSNEASVTVTVNSVNDVPSFTKGANQTIDINSGIQVVTDWATGISAGPANESGQTLTFSCTNNNNSLFSEQPAVDSNGILYYTPANGAVGTATVSITLKDDGGTSNGGVDESNTQTFTITVSPEMPTITTNWTMEIKASSAKSGGNVTDNGGATLSARGVCWNTTGTPTTADSKNNETGDTGLFNSLLSGLTAGTTYYVRAFATNSKGTAYGNEVNFTYVDTDKNLTDIVSNENSDIAIGNNKTLTANTNKSVHSINIEPGSKLDHTSNNLTINTLVLKSDILSSFKLNIGDGIDALNLYYQKAIDDLRWFFLSFPCPVQVSGISKADGSSLGVLQTDWYIRYYDAVTRLQNLGRVTNWKSIPTAEETTLIKNKGYIFGVPDGSSVTDLKFTLDPAIIQVTDNESRNVSVIAHGDGLTKNDNNDDVTNNHKGWNFIGQPYLTEYWVNNIDVNYSLFPEGNLGKTYAVDYKITTGRLVQPFSAYFVQADAAMQTRKVNFSSLGRKRNVPAVLNQVNENQLLEIAISNQDVSDKTFLILNDTYTNQYTISEDMEKWLITSTEKPQLFTTINKIRYAYNGLSTADLNNSITLDYYVKNPGKYTIKADNSYGSAIPRLYLKDLQNNMVVDLINGSYMFDTNSGINTGRFVLSLTDVFTEIENPDNDYSDEINITDGQLFIGIKNSGTSVCVFDVLGKLIYQSNKISEYTQVKVPADGVYLIQIKNNNGTKILKQFLNQN